MSRFRIIYTCPLNLLCTLLFGTSLNNLPLSCSLSSIISLAARCAMPSFRMHLRARGKVAQVFKMLNDAPQHPVGICSNLQQQLTQTNNSNGPKIKGFSRVTINLPLLICGGSMTYYLSCRYFKVRYLNIKGKDSRTFPATSCF